MNISVPKHSLYNKGKGLNRQYVYKLDNLIQSCLDRSPKICAIRVDLHVPDNELLDRRNLIKRFIESLKAQLKHNESKRKRQGKRVHVNKLSYVWAREYGKDNELEHYHLVLIFNANAYNRLGSYQYEGSMANRINKAWLSALGSIVSEEEGLVHFPDNGTYIVNSNADSYEEQLEDLMYRASYLCKETTKRISRQERSFDTSLVRVHRVR